MSEKKTILVDVDDVCALLMHGWLAKYNEEYQDCLTKDKITDWDITKAVKPECGKDIYKYLHEKSLYDVVPPIPGALEGIQKLRELGLRVVYATACNIHMAGRKALWLQEHGFLDKPLLHGTTTHEVVELYDKSLLRGWALIDDGPHNLKNFVGHRILLDQAHNHSADRASYDYRCMDWKDVVYRVEQLLKQDLAVWH